MFWFRGRKNRKAFEVEIHFIEEEIHRSKRFGHEFGVLVMEVSNNVPRGLSKVLPGRTISFHVLEQNLRGYDRIIGPDLRRYYVILPQTDSTGINAVKERLFHLADEQQWGDVSIGYAAYPADGKKPEHLLEKANLGLADPPALSKMAATG